MRKICTLLSCLFIGSYAPADDSELTKPNTLTQKEISTGWVLMFDGETTFGWKVKGEAQVKDGELILGDTKPSKATLTTSLRDCNLRFDHKKGSHGRYRFDIRSAEGSQEVVGGSLVSVGGDVAGWSVLDCKVRTEPEPGSDMKSAFRATKGEKIFGGVYSGISTNQLAFCDNSLATFSLEVGAGQQLAIRNFKLKPAGSNSIFNGEDLAGWVEIPGRKSTFSVTEAGELSITNGPGDLQTVGQWGDFVLQLDIKANGKHLNSGIFFRAIAGKFWSGYESQIRNQWEGDDRTKPVDFGTGGIYNRQPARNVVSSDNQWFTKTVMATGNHLAVWVNGIQVSDFTDERPGNENARKGTKLGKGPISLQGHDPKTDLSFRNIRVADWSISNNSD